MIKLPISIALAAAVVLGATACKSDITRESRDVEEAREDLQEAQEDAREQPYDEDEREDVREQRSDLQEEQTELQATVREEINDSEQRFTDLQQRVNTLSLDTSTGAGANIKQAMDRAKTKLQAARDAESPQLVRQALNETDDALDRLEQAIDEYDDEV